MSSESERQQLIEELERKNDIARLQETIALMITVSCVFIALFIYTHESHWNVKGTSILISFSLIGLLVVWLLFRTIAGCAPIFIDDSYFEQEADRILSAESGTDDTDS